MEPKDIKSQQSWLSTQDSDNTTSSNLDTKSAEKTETSPHKSSRHSLKSGQRTTVRKDSTSSNFQEVQPHSPSSSKHREIDRDRYSGINRKRRRESDDESREITRDTSKKVKMNEYRSIHHGNAPSRRDADPHFSFQYEKSHPNSYRTQVPPSGSFLSRGESGQSKTARTEKTHFRFPRYPRYASPHTLHHSRNSSKIDNSRNQARTHSHSLTKNTSISSRERRFDRSRFPGGVKFKPHQKSTLNGPAGNCQSLAELEAWTRKNFNRLKRDIENFYNSYESIFLGLMITLQRLSKHQTNIDINSMPNTLEIITWFFTPGHSSHINSGEIGNIVHLLKVTFMLHFSEESVQPLIIVIAKNIASIIKISEKFAELRRYDRMVKDVLLLPSICGSIEYMLTMGYYYIAESNQEYSKSIEQNKKDIIQVLCRLIPELCKQEHKLITMSYCVSYLGKMISTPKPDFSLDSQLIPKLIVQLLNNYNKIFSLTLKKQGNSKDPIDFKKPIKNFLFSISSIVNSQWITQAQKHDILNHLDIFISDNHQFFTKNQEISFMLLSFLSCYYAFLNKSIPLRLYRRSLSFQNSWLTASHSITTSFETDSSKILDIIKITNFLLCNDQIKDLDQTARDALRNNASHVIDHLTKWFNHSSNIDIKPIFEMLLLFNQIGLHTSDDYEKDRVLSFMKTVNKVTLSNSQSNLLSTNQDDALRLFIMELNGETFQYPINFERIKHNHQLLFAHATSQMIASNRRQLLFFNVFSKANVVLGSEIIESLNKMTETKKDHPVDLAKKITCFKKNIEFLYHLAMLFFKHTDNGLSTPQEYQHIYLAVYLFEQIGLLDPSERAPLKQLSSILSQQIKKIFQKEKSNAYTTHHLDNVISSTPFDREEECCVECFGCTLPPVDYKISYTSSKKHPKIKYVIYLEVQDQIHYVHLRDHKHRFYRKANTRTRAKRQILELALHTQQLSSNTTHQAAALPIRPQSSQSISDVDSETTYKIYFIELNKRQANAQPNELVKYENSSQGFMKFVTFLRSKAFYSSEITASDEYFKHIQASITQLSKETIERPSSSTDDETQLV